MKLVPKGPDRIEFFAMKVGDKYISSHLSLMRLGIRYALPQPASLSYFLYKINRIYICRKHTLFPLIAMPGPLGLHPPKPELIIYYPI